MITESLPKAILGARSFANMGYTFPTVSNDIYTWICWGI